MIRHIVASKSARIAAWTEFLAVAGGVGCIRGTDSNTLVGSFYTIELTVILCT